jgi:hypothetical protein
MMAEICVDREPRVCPGRHALRSRDSAKNRSIPEGQRDVSVLYGKFLLAWGHEPILFDFLVIAHYRARYECSQSNPSV